jgi:hypothetical protein
MVRMVRGPGHNMGGPAAAATLCPECGEAVPADVQHAVDVHGERWHAECVLHEVKARARGEDGGTSPSSTG